MRQSFWSTMRTSPSLTTSAESPPGPSVIDVSTWIATVSPPPRSSSSPSVVRTSSVKPRPRIRRSQLARRVAGQQDRDVAAQVVGAATARRSDRRGGARRTGSRRRSIRASRSSLSWSLRGKGNQEPKKAGTEPRVADDRAVVGLDEDPGVAERRRSHHRRSNLPITGEARRGRPVGSGDGRVGVLLAGARHVLGPRRAVPVAQLEAAGRVGVPPGRDRRRARRAGRRARRAGLTRRGPCRATGGRRRRAGPLPHELVEPGSVDDGPQLPALLAAGAAPQPDGSAGELADPDALGELSACSPAAEEAAHVLVGSVDDVLEEVDDAVSRFRNAVTSLPVGTMATTSQPSPDFSVSLAASVDASKVETLTESNSDMGGTITTRPSLGGRACPRRRRSPARRRRSRRRAAPRRAPIRSPS